MAHTGRVAVARKHKNIVRNMYIYCPRQLNHFIFGCSKSYMVLPPTPFNPTIEDFLVLM